METLLALGAISSIILLSLVIAGAIYAVIDDKFDNDQHFPH